MGTTRWLVGSWQFSIDVSPKFQFTRCQGGMERGMQGPRSQRRASRSATRDFSCRGCPTQRRGLIAQLGQLDTSIGSSLMRSQAKKTMFRLTSPIVQPTNVESLSLVSRHNAYGFSAARLSSCEQTRSYDCSALGEAATEWGFDDESDPGHEEKSHNPYLRSYQWREVESQVYTSVPLRALTVWGFGA